MPEGEPPDRTLDLDRGPVAARNTRRSRVYRLLPWIGLSLFVACLAALLHSLSSPPGTISTWERSRGGVAVVLDPGHGGIDTGAVAQGVVEKDLNLDVARRVARALETLGYHSKLTREDDHFVALESRVQLANALPDAIFVSIHFNDAQGEGRASSRASGIETYYSATKQNSPTASLFWTTLFGGAKTGNRPDAMRAGELLAGSIQQALIAGTAAADRGIKEEALYVTRRVRGPAVLVEGGFVSHPLEARLLQEPAYRQKIADAIAAGIVRYLTAAPLRA